MECCLSDRFIAAGEEMCDLFHFVPAPYLRKNVVLPAQVRQASLSVCGLGFYRLFVNGRDITKGLLSPYISNPDQVMDYDVYDLTGFLQAGKNTLAFQLGNGMQNCFGGYVWDFEKAAFRSAPKLAVWFSCECAGGQTVEFEADESFLCADSPVLYDDLRQGEKYDANREIPGWNLPDFDDSGWRPAIRAVTPGGIRRICRAKPIVKTGERTPVSIRPDTIRFRERPDTYSGYLYDFGENLAGLAHLRIRGEKGQRVTMIFGEYIGADGHFSVDNIRFERKEYQSLPLGIQMDEYICRGGGEENYLPSFTYHGFRYVLVCGITPEQAVPELLTYEVMNTGLVSRGGFSSGDPVLNRLQQMTRQSILANFYHFPTDCPHREKNGWTADAALSAVACLLNFDPEENYREWLVHIRSAARQDGSLPGIVPTGGWGFDWGNGPAWDQVLVTLTELVYRFTGDISCVQDNADALYRYCRYIDSRRDKNGLIAIGLGDWCAPHKGPKSPLIFTDSVISMDIARRSAFLLEAAGREVEARYCQNLSESFLLSIREHLIGWGLTAKGRCQTSQAMALYYGVFTPQEKEKAYARLLRYIRKCGGHIDCGVLGARVLFRVLSDGGDTDLALRILKQKTPPSYGNWVERGETSLCEDFAPYEEHVNSLNHHFFGDISAWFIECLAGIRMNPDCRDVSHCDIAPSFCESLEDCRGEFHTAAGSVVSAWSGGNGVFELTLEYPEGLHGEILLPPGYLFEDGMKKKKAAPGRYVVIRP